MFQSLFTRRSTRDLRNFLTIHTDALLAGTLDLNKLLELYDTVAWSQVEGLVQLVERLNRSMVEVTPSEHFVEQLRRQLLEIPTFEQPSLWQRIRELPPRTQLAAGIGGATLTAGVVLLASRPVLGAVNNVWRNRRTVIA
jgi:hypothetical protein